ncbi:hypothetical protein XENOCAPTIV_005226 [Xenoophorus captivus]|uniref:Secreted protein n=1 Tax=Xenoophorus captivus TaxID=1517983 RepID=A0ABV0QGK9_9TELE
MITVGFVLLLHFTVRSFFVSHHQPHKLKLHIALVLPSGPLSDAKHRHHLSLQCLQDVQQAAADVTLCTVGLVGRLGCVCGCVTALTSSAQQSRSQCCSPSPSEPSWGCISRQTCGRSASLGPGPPLKTPH